ncbi:hypothetical protein [Actinoplanes sp. NPDC026623]|uniref:hypothetical protein n=1 Tax=Actinoplanes sp. NPDC026623 TaxID=3155610 RepID=UPI003406D6D3
MVDLEGIRMATRRTSARHHRDGLSHRLAIAAGHAGAALAVHAPDLLDGFTAALPEATEIVGRRLRGALVREGLLPTGRGDRVHAFRRVGPPSGPVNTHRQAEHRADRQELRHAAPACRR